MFLAATTGSGRFNITNLFTAFFDQQGALFDPFCGRKGQR
jgi:hypothetical protein